VKLQKVASLFDIIDNINDPMKGFCFGTSTLYGTDRPGINKYIIMCVFSLLLLNLSFKFIFHASVMGFILSDVWCLPQNDMPSGAYPTDEPN
jgi:hypothetical protein